MAMNKQIIAICILIGCVCIGRASNHRSKRFLTFPRTSPTRLQLIMGIGIPVSLKIESVTIGWVNKVEFFLPENASNFLSFFNDPFDLTTRPIYGYYDKRSADSNQPIPLLEEPKPTDAPATFPVDVDPNEPYEKHQAPVKIVERSMENDNDDADDDDGDDDDDDDEDFNRNGLSDADYWNQESEPAWFDDYFKPKRPKDLSKLRWGIYKTMAVFAER